jgi:hypothetical protein
MHNQPEMPEIPYWSPQEAAEAMEAINEAKAKQKYADMLADATFPPGSVVREIV